MTTDEQHPDPITRWRHRRTMAYMALIGMVAYPALFLFADSQHLAAVAWPIMLSLSAVIGAYVGFSTWETVRITGTAK